MELSQTPVQPLPPETQIIEPKKSLPKWPLIIAGLILIIIALTGTYFLGKNSASKTQSETAKTASPTPTPASINGLRTYSNSNYGFSFQYPSYLTRLEDNLPKKPTGIQSDNLRITSSDYKYDLQLYINPGFGGMCVGTWIYNAKQVGSVLKFTKTQGDNPNLPEGATCSDFYSARIILSNGDKILMNLGYDSKKPNAQKDFETILSTFKFTDQTSQNNDTSTWKTFTTKSGISFKYPTDWTPNEVITPKDSGGYGPIDSVKLTSPNGLIVTYGNYISGLGGGCDPANCPYNHVLKVEPVNIPGYGTLNLVELVVKDGNDSSVIDAQVGLIDPKTYPNLQVGSKKQFGYYVMFKDKDPNKYLDQFSVYVYDSNLKNNKVGQFSDLSQYFKDPEVITAENILKTLSF